MRPLHGAQYLCRLTHVPVRQKRDAFVDHRHTFKCSSSLEEVGDRRTFISISVSLRNNLGDLVFKGAGLAGFHSTVMQCFIIGLGCSLHFYLRLFSLSILSSDASWYSGTGVFGLTRCKSLSPSLALRTFFLY